MKLDLDALGALVATSTDAFTVNIAPALGLSTPLRIGLDDVSRLVQTGEPAFHLEVDGATVTVKSESGGWLAELMVRF